MGVTFEGALCFTKFSVYLACTWPPPRIASKWEIMKYNIVWWIFFLSALSLFFPLVFSISKYRSNTLIVTQSVCFLGAGSNLLFKMIVYRLHFERTQVLKNSFKYCKCCTVITVAVQPSRPQRLSVHSLVSARVFIKISKKCIY